MNGLYIRRFHIEVHTQAHINAEFRPVLMLRVQVFMNHIPVTAGLVSAEYFHTRVNPLYWIQ